MSVMGAPPRDLIFFPGSWHPIWVQLVTGYVSLIASDFLGARGIKEKNM